MCMWTPLHACMTCILHGMHEAQIFCMSSHGAWIFCMSVHEAQIFCMLTCAIKLAHLLLTSKKDWSSQDVIIRFSTHGQVLQVLTKGWPVPRQDLIAIHLDDLGESHTSLLPMQGNTSTHEVTQSLLKSDWSTTSSRLGSTYKTFALSQIRLAFSQIRLFSKSQVCLYKQSWRMTHDAAILTKGRQFY